MPRTKKKKQQPLWRLLPYLKPYGGKIALGVSLIILVSISNLPYPWIITQVIDKVIPNKDMNYFLLLLGLFFASIIVGNVLMYFRGKTLQELGMSVVCQLRKDLFAHLQYLSLKYYDEKHSGNIVTKVTQDTDAVFGLITNVFVNLIADSLTIIIVFAVMFFINWKLALLIACILPFFFFNFNSSRKKIREISRVHRANWAYVVNFLNERVIAARTIKSFAMEEAEKQRFNKANDMDYNYFNEFIRRIIKLTATSAGISGIATLGIIGFGTVLILHGELTVGKLIGFNTFLAILLMPIQRLADLNNIIQRAITGLENIFELLDERSAVEDKPHAKTLTVKDGTVEFRNVSFSYNENKSALKKINLKIKPNTMAAFVGSSGAGKSTIINLLARFYDCDSGEILIDGQNIKNVTLTSLRANIGIVPQESMLFSGTIRENVAYGKPDATEEEIARALKIANAYDFVMKFDKKLDSIVGERGVQLSGGERQRIAIARAVLRDPKILIFDEATSALDSENELAIQDAMKRLMKNRTTLVIAHRLSTIRRANVIFVLKNGTIAEKGTHRKLITNSKSFYKYLNDLQNQTE